MSDWRDLRRNVRGMMGWMSGMFAVLGVILFFAGLGLLAANSWMWTYANAIFLFGGIVVVIAAFIKKHPAIDGAILAIVLVLGFLTLIW